MKICSICKLEKSESEFYFNPAKLGQHNHAYPRGDCKSCVNAIAKSRPIFEDEDIDFCNEISEAKGA